MKRSYETIRVDTVTTSDGAIFQTKDAEKVAHDHERRIQVIAALQRRGFLAVGQVEERLLNAVLETFDDLIEAFHTEGVLTEGYGTRDDF